MFPIVTGQVSRGVQHTRELQRVIGIARRTWTEAEAEALALEMSAAMRLPGGNMTFRAIQAQAIYEAWSRGGLFGPIRVGGGKTLLSLILPWVLQARRPLLLLPAKLIEKTKREMRELARHWPIPNFIRIVSYELLGRNQAAETLQQYQPDLIVADEVHKLKNPKAAVTKRVTRYMTGSPGTKFVALSGTITIRSLKDFAHIIRWCLKPELCPVPGSWSDLEDWADALDEKTTGENKCHPGALLLLCNDQERQIPDPREAARKAFRRRLVETPGVVATTEIHDAACSIIIEASECDMKREIEDAFELLRMTWTTPDGWPISDPMTLRRHARELALGFFYKWDPRPPEEWIQARRDWSKACREILTNNRRDLDSEVPVIAAVEKGFYPDAKPALDEWRRIKDTFTPNTVPVWIDDSIVRAASLWATQAPGIVWSEHRAFGIELARQSKLSYYAELGQDTITRRAIELHNPAESMIASIQSNAEGRNLQAWNRNLIISPPSNGGKWEQLLGRTHRPGQLADECTFDVMLTCIEHALAVYQARQDARFIEHTTGQAQKLLYADVIYPDPEEISRPGFRWNR